MSHQCRFRNSLAECRVACMKVGWWQPCEKSPSDCPDAEEPVICPSYEPPTHCPYCGQELGENYVEFGPESFPRRAHPACYERQRRRWVEQRKNSIEFQRDRMGCVNGEGGCF